jgi:hypothetical protein
MLLYSNIPVLLVSCKAILTLVSASDSFPLRQRQINFDDILDDLPDDIRDPIDQILNPPDETATASDPVITLNPPDDIVDDVAPIIDRPIFDTPSGTTGAPAGPTNSPDEGPDQSEEVLGLCGALTQEDWEEGGMPSRVTE